MNEKNEVLSSKLWNSGNLSDSHGSFLALYGDIGKDI